MIGPVTVQGRGPSNVVELSGQHTGALLVMRRPAMVRSRETGIRWYVGCQAEILLQERTFVHVPAYPPRRRRSYFVDDELPLAPLPAVPRVVAVAMFPMEVLGWRFEFFADQPEHPDAAAEVWVHELAQVHASCGIFRAAFRG